MAMPANFFNHLKLNRAFRLSKIWDARELQTQLRDINREFDALDPDIKDDNVAAMRLNNDIISYIAAYELEVEYLQGLLDLECCCGKRDWQNMASIEY